MKTLLLWLIFFGRIYTIEFKIRLNLPILEFNLVVLIKTKKNSFCLTILLFYGKFLVTNVFFF